MHGYMANSTIIVMSYVELSIFF